MRHGDAMHDIDGRLARMAGEPVPAGLAAIDAGVLARVGAGPVRTRGPGIATVAVIAAAGGLGVLGAGVPLAPTPAGAAALFGIAGAPVPSTLLGDGA